MPIANQKLMSDLPTSAPEEEINPAQAWVDSLDPEKQGNLTPGRNEAHNQEIARIQNLILRGYLDKPRVEKLAKLNPRAAPMFYDALTQGSAYQAQQDAINNVYSRNFQPARDVQNYIMAPDAQGNIPPIKIQAKSDYNTAINQLLSLGQVDRAKALEEMRKAGQGGGGKFSSLDAAYASIGVKDPRNATPEQHKKALEIFQTPIQVTTVGPEGDETRQIIPRGAAVGKGFGTGKNAYSDELAKLTKSTKDANLPEVDVYVDALDQKLEKYKESGIPGIGGLENMSWTNFMKSPEGRETYADAMGVITSILRAGAGLAQTQGEADRIKQKLAAGAFNTAGDFYKQFQKVKQIYDRERAAIVSGARPEVVKIWEERNPSGTKLTISPWAERAKKNSGLTPKQRRLKALMSQ